MRKIAPGAPRREPLTALRATANRLLVHVTPFGARAVEPAPEVA